MTVEEIREKVTTNQRWLERAILAVYARQTTDEQNMEETRWANGRGFTGPDANMMSYWAKWIQSGKHLSGTHLTRAFKRIGKYAGQLKKVVNEGGENV